MRAVKLFGLLFAVFGAIICENGVNSLLPSIPLLNKETIVDYDDGLLRLTEDFVVATLQSLDLVLAGESDYPPIEEDVTFWCTKPNSGEFVKVLLNDPNLADYFDLTKPLGLIVHGWVSTFRGGFLSNFSKTNGWMELLANEYAHFSDTNVCCVDWSRLAVYEYALTVYVNLPLVVSYVTEFVTKLLELKITKTKHLTIIGHSLGAHIAGRVGANFNGAIKNIFGLDPAGPLFTFPAMTDSSFHLDKTDAKYVQVLHTDGLLLGTAVNLGHTDIYANGGTLQPGCLLPLLDMKSPFAPIPVICDHYAAVAFFTSSCNPSYEFITTSSNSTGLLIDTVQPVVQFADTLLLAEGPNFPAPAYENNPPNVHDLLGPFNHGHHGQFIMSTTLNFPYTKNVIHHHHHQH